MTATTYAEAEATWRRAKSSIERLITSERSAAQRELDARVARLSAAANQARTTMLVASRAALLLPNPISGLHAAWAAIDYARASGAASAAVADRTSSRAAGEALITDLRACVARIDAWMHDKAAGAADTPQRFRALHDRWKSTRARINEVERDITVRGRSSAWISTASSEAYLTAVNPQLSALAEMSDAVGNHATACLGVAVCQEQIFGMIEHRHMDAEFEARSQAQRSSSRASLGDFFGGIRAMITHARTLEGYLITRGKGDWSRRGLGIGRELQDGLAAVQTLDDGWPERTEHADEVVESAVPVVTGKG